MDNSHMDDSQKISSRRIKLKVEALEIRRDSSPFGLSSLTRRNVYSCTFGDEGLVLVGGAVNHHRIRYPVKLYEEYGKVFEERTDPLEVELKNCKASQLLVAASNIGYYAVAPAAIFTRHSGTCRILGGAIHKQSVLQELHLGDILRLGSVGLVVSEMCLTEGGAPEFLGADAVECLQQDAAEVLMKEVEAGGENFVAQSTDKDMEEDTSKQFGSRSRMSSLLSGVRTPTSNLSVRRNTRKFSQASHASLSKTISDERMCYVCFDDEDTIENPILAPCDCSGSTKWIHLNCLQTWSKSNQRSQVCLAVNPSGAPVCTVCKSAYKANCRTSYGNVVSLRAMSLKPPYICFTVVTKHHGVAAEPLFSTKFYVSFDMILDKARRKGMRGLSVGRSHRCDMMLDCQTVSVMHGLIFYNNGKFSYKDTKSKNGSMLYLREPLYLPPGRDIVLKWGDAFVTLTVQKTTFEIIFDYFKRMINFGREPPQKSEVPVSGRISPITEDLSKLQHLCRVTSEIPASRSNFMRLHSRSGSNHKFTYHHHSSASYPTTHPSFSRTGLALPESKEHSEASSNYLDFELSQALRRPHEGESNTNPMMALVENNVERPSTTPPRPGANDDQCSLLVERGSISSNDYLCSRSHGDPDISITRQSSGGDLSTTILPTNSMEEKNSADQLNFDGVSEQLSRLSMDEGTHGEVKFDEHV